ncbi:hypothetical protein [Ruminococcus flavefaciens]|uniref:hypothetical protein n=1 Tax=Ruminococcus flavefaciens TaxID=1265 RepID=UPI0026EA84A0|nr:hypothetical protein [Ruminococcus flavefaciens]
MKVELVDYIEKINNSFIEARKTYKEWYNTFIEDDNRHLAELKATKKDYTTEGYNNRLAAILDEKRVHAGKIAAQIDRFNAHVAKLRESCKAEFKDTYSITPRSLDMAAVELIKSGILTDAELLDLAQTEYVNNATMLRYIGNTLQKSEDKAMQQKGAALMARSQNNLHLELFDELVRICNSCLRPEHYDAGGRLIDIERAYELSNNMEAELYNNAYTEIKNKALQYSAELSD